jgi:predicted membrane-bound spermidine synthase
VCIIGGGDGAVIGEVFKHKGVKEIVLCEIDKVASERIRCCCLGDDFVQCFLAAGVSAARAVGRQS